MHSLRDGSVQRADVFADKIARDARSSSAGTILILNLFSNIHCGMTLAMHSAA